MPQDCSRIETGEEVVVGEKYRSGGDDGMREMSKLM
jgi:hypothetical protein